MLKLPINLSRSCGLKDLDAEEVECDVEIREELVPADEPLDRDHATEPEDVVRDVQAA